MRSRPDGLFANRKKNFFCKCTEMLKAKSRRRESPGAQRWLPDEQLVKNRGLSVILQGRDRSLARDLTQDS